MIVGLVEKLLGKGVKGNKHPEDVALITLLLLSIKI